MRNLLLIALLAFTFLLPVPTLADRRAPRRPQVRAPHKQQPRARVHPGQQRKRVAKPRPRQQYKLRDLSKSLFSGNKTANKDRISHGSWYTRKEIRSRIYNARSSDHGRKHLKARTEAEATKFSTKAAQYLPGVNNKQLERTALQKGTLIRRAGGDVWSIYRANKPVGYDGGEKTHWMRAELSSGTIHGHPMKLSRVLKYLKDAE